MILGTYNCTSPSLGCSDVIVIVDSEDKPPAKRQKVDKDICVICLEEGAKINKVLTTKCCKQKGHVSCLRMYYKLPAESRSQGSEIAGRPKLFRFSRRSRELRAIG